MSISADPKTIKALVFDLDGTVLAPGTVLHDRTLKAVKACKERGIRIIIATGRALAAAERFRIPLGAEGPMIYFNGAVVADMPGAGLLKSTLLDIKAAEFCAGLSRELGVYYQVFFPGTKDDPRITLMAERDFPEREMYFSHTGIRAELGDLKEALARPGLGGCVKVMFIAEPDVIPRIRPRLTEHFGGTVYITQALRNFLEVMNPEVSKGSALTFIMERLSLTPEEVIAFGDDENDLPMLGAAGFSAAPSNAKDSVKAAADEILLSNAEDGVAVFLEKFFSLGC